MKKLRVIDLYCGAGGTSTGLMQAAQEHGVAVDLTPINHWETAVNTHAANHPEARHVCASIEDLRPEQFARRGELDWLVASPECTHFSRARGGLPVDDQRRVGARRVLNCADHGAPTTRTRLIIQAARTGLRCVWPTPSHRSPDDNTDLPTWRTARECIDWGIECPSIFTRKKPLSSNTLRRIEAGLNLKGLVDFMVQGNFGNDARPNRVRDVDQPLGTIVTGQTWGLVKPFIVTLRGTSSIALTQTASSVDLPLGTLTTSGNHHALIQPALLPQQSDGRLRPVSEPCPTVSTAGAIALINPVLIEYYSTGTHTSCEKPMPTVTCKPRFDIGYRMLNYHETAAAQSFPSDYKFTGTITEIHKQIGNAVPPALARQLFRAALSN